MTLLAPLAALLRLLLSGAALLLALTWRWPLAIELDPAALAESDARLERARRALRTP